MHDKIILIGCSIFQEEITQIIEERKPGLTIDWQEVGLHDNIELLEETLDSRLEAARQSGAKIGFLYGWACLPEMKKFAKDRGVKYLPAKNCLAALVGDERLKELEQDRTLVASPGWVRKMWLGRAGTATGWTADDYRMQFGRYDRILVLDPGLKPLSDEEIINCFDLVQVPIETLACDLDHFKLAFNDLFEAVGR